LRLEEVGARAGRAKFELSLNLAQRDGRLLGSLEYAADLYDRTTAERMTGHWERLLESAMAHPQQPIGEVERLTIAEREQLLVEWNRTAAEYPQKACVQDLFESQARRTPDAVAVIFEDSTLSYGELNCRSNQLARLLRKLGVGPGSLVGICLER